MKPRVIAIGDIHGCYYSFRELVEEKIRPVKAEQLILLGDYIDRGPDSKKVVDYIIDLQSSGFDLVALKGNHEAMLMDAWNNPDRLSLWFLNGGMTTLKSFGINNLSELASGYLNFFRELPYYHESGDYLFVHAGFNDHAQNPFDDKVSMLWHSSMEYHHPMLKNKTIIHGHQTIKYDCLTESNLLESRVIDIDTGCVYTGIAGYGKLTAIEVNSRAIVSV